MAQPSEDGGPESQPDPRSGDSAEEPHHSITAWLQVDRDVAEGLHILRMSADPGWIVRKDLYIKLKSLVHADVLYAVDIDLGKVMAGLPRIVADEVREANDRGDDRPIWLPILRQPAVEAFSQRVTSATDGNRQAVPIMRSADVRYRLAAALTWLFLTGCFQARGPKPRLGEIARLQLIVQQALLGYLTTGSKASIDEVLMGDPTAPAPLARQALDALTELVVDPVPSDTGARRPAGRVLRPDIDERRQAYAEAFSHCLTYARSGRFVVVGLTQHNSRRIECHLIPTELRVSNDEPPRRPTTALGFDLTAGRYAPQPNGRWPTWPGRAWDRLASRFRRPSTFHFQFPLPEVSLLDGSHVTIETEDDVAISPAVLFHDHTVDHLDRPGVWHAQAYQVEHWLTPLQLELNRPGGDHRPERLVEELRTVALPDFRRTERALAARLQRLEQARAVLGSPKGTHRRTSEGDDTPPLPTVTATREAHERARRILDTIQPPSPGAGGDEGANPVDLAIRSRLARRQLEELAESLGANPHLELTADDDPREHVAHFHVAEARSITPRDRDRRPVVHAVLRASRTGANGYARMATLTCQAIAALLVLVGVVIGIATFTGRTVAVEGLVTLLLLVPGISAALLGRVPADTIRYVVLRRWVNLVLFSLSWPAVAALLLAAFLDGITGEPGDPDARPWLLSLAFPILAGVVVAVRAQYRYRRARAGFDPGEHLRGRIVPDHKEDPGVESSRSTSASYHRADVDTRVVLDVCSAGLFQTNQPSRRFMVWVGIHNDRPGDFDRVVRTLESTVDGNGGPPPSPADDPGGGGLTQRLSERARQVGGRLLGDPEPERSSSELTIESSTCQSVGGSGAVMAIISGERHLFRAQQAQTEMALARGFLERLSKAPNFGGDDDREVRVIVDEVDEAPNYFLYNAPRFIDTVFSVPLHRRNTIPWLIKQIWALDQRRFRVSYLHCPPAPARSKNAPDGEPRAILKLGLAFDREYESLVASSLLDLHRFVERIDGARLEAFDRRAYPEPAADGAEPPPAGYQARVISSAGPGDAAMMRALINRLYPADPELGPDDPDHFGDRAPVQFVGGSIMTAGGYASRVFRLDMTDEAAEAFGDSLLVEGAGPEDENVRTWANAAMAHQGSPRWVETFPVWLRWQIDGENLTELLEASRHFEVRSTGATDGPGEGRTEGPVDSTADGFAGTEGFGSAQLNLEYLNNRLNDLGQINGKARYRARGLWTSEEEAESFATEYRRALQTALQRNLADRLAGTSTYVRVSDEEPRRPASSSERESEFNSY